MAVKASWTRGIEESDLLAVANINLISANMLGDAAGFAGHNIGFAQGVEQGGLAMIDMPMMVTTGTRGCKFSSASAAPPMPISTSASDTRLTFVAKLLDDKLSGILINRIDDGCHDVHLHKCFDNLAATLGHAVGQLRQR